MIFVNNPFGEDLMDIYEESEADRIWWHSWCDIAYVIERVTILEFLDGARIVLETVLRVFYPFDVITLFGKGRVLCCHWQSHDQHQEH